jgi:hypothetical protein
MVKLIAGLSLLAVAALGGVVLALAHFGGGDDVEEAVQRDMPRKADYSFVALPVSAAPVGASVETSHYADEERDGQVVLLRYPEVSLQACSLIVDVSAPHTCAARGREVVRVVDHDGVRTTLFLGTKKGSLQGDENMVGELRAWVENARFTAAPDWVATYAHDQLERMYAG